MQHEHLTPNQRRTANARATLESLPPDELRERKQRAAKASAEARRQVRDETITVKIVPAHKLSPAQVQAWRKLWTVLLAPIEDDGSDEAA